MVGTVHLLVLFRLAPGPELHFGFGFLRLAETSASELLPIEGPGRVRFASISSAWWIPKVSWADSTSALSNGWVQWAPEGQFEFEFEKVF